jgi:FeS assembly protein IscX
MLPLDSYETGNQSDLSWESTYAIARELIHRHPEVDLGEVSITQIQEWTLALPNFFDDPEMVNDSILLSIYQEWYEEVNPV